MLKKQITAGLPWHFACSGGIHFKALAVLFDNGDNEPMPPIIWANGLATSHDKSGKILPKSVDDHVLLYKGQDEDTAFMKDGNTEEIENAYDWLMQSSSFSMSSFMELTEHPLKMVNSPYHSRSR